MIFLGIIAAMLLFAVTVAIAVNVIYPDWRNPYIALLVVVLATGILV